MAKVKIHRFPRLLKDYPDVRLTKFQRQMMAKGSALPRGYDKLTKKQKRLARYIINGSTVKDACKKLGMDTNTFYKYMHRHPLFKQYYLRYAQRAASEIEGRLDAKLGRALQIVETTMDYPDPYLQYTVAKDFLHGRGKYTKNIESKRQITGAIKLHGEIKNTGKVPDKEFVMMFVNAVMGKSISGKVMEPKIIKGKVVEKVLNELPEPAPNASLSTEIQKVDSRTA